MNLFNHKYVLAAALVAGMLGQSCTKTGHSIDAPASAYINIFNASHVYDSMAAHTTQPRTVLLSGFDTTSSQSQIRFQALGYLEIPDNGPLEAIRFDRPMHFYNFAAGGQQVRFLDTAGAIVADTSFDFPTGSYNGIYLADDTAHADTYNRSGLFRVFSFPEQKTSTPGKIRLRYIDLVPDVDTLNGYILASDGSQFTGDATPHALTYGTASSYYDLDTTGLVINGELRLRLYQKTNMTTTVVQTAIPATPGRTYTVLLFGHAGYWPCNFQVKQPDGSTQQKFVSYPPNIKGYIRTID